MLPKKDLEAIHEQDLKTLLKNWGMLDAFEAGTIKCRFCGDSILGKNFGAIFSENKQVFFSCSKLDCLAKLRPNK